MVAVLGFTVVLIGIGMFGQSATVATSSTTEPLLLDVDEPVSSTGVAVDVPPPAGEIPGLSGRVVVVTGIGESDGYYRQVRLRVWDAGSGMMITSELERSAFGFAVDPAGEHLAFRAADGAVWIQDLAAPSGKVVIAGGVGSLAWSPDGSRLAVVEGNPSAEGWALAAYPYEEGALGRREEITTMGAGGLLLGWNDAGLWVAEEMNQPGARVAVYGDDGVVVADIPGAWAWVGSGERAAVYSPGDQNPVRVVDLTSTGDGFRVPSGSGLFAWPTDPDDTRLAETGIDEGASEAGWLQVWDTATGELLHRYDLAAPYGVSWDWSDRFVVMPAHRGVGRVYFYDTVDGSLHDLSFGEEIVWFAAVVSPSPTLNPTRPAVQN